MKPVPNPLPEVVCDVSSVLVLILSCSVLWAWANHVREVVQVMEGSAPMQVNTALMLGLVALAMLLTRMRMARGAIGAAAVAVAIGALTTAQYLFGVDLGIDELLWRADITELTPFPGRPSLGAALALVALGVSVAVVARGLMSRLRRLLVHIGVACSVLIATTTLVGYVTGVPWLYQWQPTVTAVAPHAAGGILALSVGLMALSAAVVALEHVQMRVVADCDCPQK